MACAALAKKGNFLRQTSVNPLRHGQPIREAIHKTGFDPLYGAWRRLDRSQTPTLFSEGKTIPASERPINHIDIGEASDWQALILLHALNRRLSRARFVRKLPGRPAEKAGAIIISAPVNTREIRGNLTSKRARKYGSLTFKRSGRWTCGSRSSSPAASSTDGTERLTENYGGRWFASSKGLQNHASRHHGARQGRCARQRR
jgi:hypothetical protein